MYEYRAVNPVQLILRRGRRKRKTNGREEPN
jgi:hypothetical protein